MSHPAFAWIVVGLYAAVLLSLALLGARRARSLQSFTVGDGSTPPQLVGLALTAQLTSVATFVINPGLVFHSGVSALLGLGLAAAAGITTGLIAFSSRFRRVGSSVAALTLPQWIGKRYESTSMRAGFSLLSLGLVAYAVLIVVALALVLGGLLGVSPTVMGTGVAAFATLCVLLGGAGSHARTNAVQAAVMLIVALLLIGRGLPLLWEGPGLFARLAALDPQLVTATNPSSFYFRSVVEVFACNFLVGLALVCQPHIVGKALYLRDDRQVRSMLQVAIAAGFVFLGVLVVGLYARVGLPADTPIDRVVPTWIAASFSPGLRLVVALGMLSAGLSTLEGILLALASIASVDVWPMLAGERGGDRAALRFGRLCLVAVAGVTSWLAAGQLANPAGGTVAIFAQYGVYLLFTGAFVPLLCGMFVPSARRPEVTAGAVAAVAGYLLAAGFEFGPYSNNPAWLATCGLGLGAATTGLGLAWRRRTGDAGAATSPPGPLADHAC
jgi:sodium/pantothenate symporter